MRPTTALPTLITALFFAPLLLAPAAAAQTTWYVDAAGVPPGSGTAVDPYVSIQYAIDQPTTLAGDTLRVAPGTYAGFTMDYWRAMTIESAQGPDHTFIAGRAYVRANDTLRGFHIENPGGTAVLMQCGRIENCLITNSAIGADGANCATVQSCTIVGCGVGIDDQPIYGGIDVNDTLLHGNGLDLYLVWWPACSLFETWETNTSGFLSQSYDPRFWDAAAGDYHLRPDSPAVGAGCWGPDVGVFSYDPTYLPTPTTYCTSKATSDGCQPTIGWNAPSNAASLGSREPFEVTAAGVSEYKNGHFFFGLAPNALPYQGGWLCVLPPTARTPNSSSGSAGAACSGSFTFDFNAHVQSGATPFLSPGMGIYGQYWYRDPADPFGSARTDAVGFALLP